MKIFWALLLFPTVALAQPRSVHYSANGNYLVDQDGKKTTIAGHPQMTCYRPHGELHGVFQKSKGGTIWMIADEWNGKSLDKWYVEIPNAVCDLK